MAFDAIIIGWCERIRSDRQQWTNYTLEAHAPRGLYVLCVYRAKAIAIAGFRTDPDMPNGASCK